MNINSNQCYEFGDFTLNPRDRILTRFNQTISLAARDFDILLYFVEHPGVIVLDRDLVNAVWGDGKIISVGSITNHITKLRRALNCDPHKPRFIVTYYGKRAYRFIGKVSQIGQIEPRISQNAVRSRDFTVESHLISPVFLGSDSFKKLSAREKVTSWATYKEFKIDNGRLCILPFGVGVWHLTERNQFTTFSDVAEWRRKIYEQILYGHHVTHVYNQELQAKPRSAEKDAFGFVTGKPGYVFSVFVLDALKFVRPDSLRKPLQLLSCLSPLEKMDSSSPNAGPKDFELQLLDETFSNLDTVEFGLPGLDIGFANWDGVSYHEMSDRETKIKNDIIEFEIAIQATWWFSKCLYDICLSNGAKVRKQLESPIQELKWQKAKLQRIIATESVSQRTMIEAILKTSRLQRLVEDTLNFFGQF